jgi:hypothetical protein
MFINRLDNILSLQLAKSLPRQTPIDFQSFHKNTDTHKSIRTDFFEEFVVRRFIEKDGIVGFILHFAFGPLLFLGWMLVLDGWWGPALPWLEAPAAFAMVDDGLVGASGKEQSN